MLGKYLVYRAGKHRATKKINKKIESLERARRAEKNHEENPVTWDSLVKMFSFKKNHDE